MPHLWDKKNQCSWARIIPGTGNALRKWDQTQTFPSPESNKLVRSCLHHKKVNLPAKQLFRQLVWGAPAPAWPHTACDGFSQRESDGIYQSKVNMGIYWGVHITVEKNHPTCFIWCICVNKYLTWKKKMLNEVKNGLWSFQGQSCLSARDLSKT